MITKYITKVANYNMDKEDEPLLGIDVPVGFLIDFDLKVGEVLEWEIDVEQKTATIRKINLIV